MKPKAPQAQGLYLALLLMIWAPICRAQFEDVATLPSDLYVYSDTHIYRVTDDGLEVIGNFVQSHDEVFLITSDGHLIVSSAGHISLVDPTDGARTSLFTWSTNENNTSAAFFDREIYLLESGWDPVISVYHLDGDSLSSKSHTMSWTNGPYEGGSPAGIAFNPVDGYLYYSYSFYSANGDVDSWITIENEGGEFMDELLVTGEVRDFAFDASGQMYGIVGGHLAMLDLQAASTQEIDTIALRGIISATHSEDYGVGPYQAYVDRLHVGETYEGFVTVTNNFSEAIEVSSVSSPTGQLELAATFPSSIAAGSSQVISFSYEANAAGDIDESLTLQLTLPDTAAIHTIAVRGLVYQEEPLWEDVFYGYNAGQFHSSNLTGEEDHVLGTVDITLTALASNDSGIAYGVSRGGDLYQVDTETGDLNYVTQLYENHSISPSHIYNMDFQTDSTLRAIVGSSVWGGGVHWSLEEYDIEDGSKSTLSTLYESLPDFPPSGRTYSAVACLNSSTYLADGTKLYLLSHQEGQLVPKEVGPFELPGMILVDMFATSHRLFGVFKDGGNNYKLAQINPSVGHALIIEGVSAVEMALARQLPNLLDGLYLSPEQLDFQFVPIEGAPIIQEMAVTNWSKEPHPFPELPELEGPFFWEHPKTGMLDPGETRVVDLVFDPVQVGEFSISIDQLTGDNELQIVGKAIQVTGLQEGFGILTNSIWESTGYVTSIYQIDATTLDKEYLGSVNAGRPIKDIDMDKQGLAYIITDHGQVFSLDLATMTLYDVSEIPLPEELNFEGEVLDDRVYEVREQGETFLIVETTETGVNEYRVRPGQGPIAVKDFELISHSHMMFLLHPQQQAVQWYLYDIRTDELTHKGVALSEEDLPDLSTSSTVFDLPAIDVLTSVPNKIVFKIYPNPADDILTVTASGRIRDFHLVDYMGRSHEVEKHFHETFWRLSLSAVPSGLYLLKIDLESGAREFRRVVVR